MKAAKTSHNRKPSKKVPRGKPKDAIFDHLVKLTGLPAKHLKSELHHILERKNIELRQITLDQLRVVVASYLREIMSGIVDKYNPKQNRHSH